MSGETRLRAAFQGRLGAFSLDASLDVPASGVTVLFGPSGCGKTSFLRCVAGLERLNGHLEVAGEVWQDGQRFLPPHRRPVGYVFQDASLLPHLSVRRNLLFGHSRLKGERPITLDQVVALLGLDGLLERGVERLSGGERQRVGIGRALLAQPRLLLMDEPLASLDAERKGEVLPYLDRLHRELATPILYVTHDRAEAARLGDRLARMAQGRIVDVAATASAGTDLEGLGALPPGEALRRLLDSGAPEGLARLAVAAAQAGLEPWREEEGGRSYEGT